MAVIFYYTDWPLEKHAPWRNQKETMLRHTDPWVYITPGNTAQTE